MNLDRRFLIWALVWAAIGMSLGIYMGVSENHGELTTHAHILLIGFVLSLIYGIIHRLWLEKPGRLIANVQFGLHQAAAITISVALFLLYGNFMPEAKLAPFLGASAVGVLLGMLLMLYMVLRFGTVAESASRATR